MTDDSNTTGETERVLESFRREILALPDYEFGGYDLMERIDDWARAWPGHVESAGCNDCGCATSGVWFIGHRRQDGTNSAVSMFHVPQCHGTAWTPLLLSMEQVSKLHRAVASPPPAPSRRFVKRGEGLADIYEADLTLAPNLNVSWLWRVDHRPISVWLACPTDFGTSFFCYPEHLPGLLDALQRTLDPVVPREAS